jgi:hypothetical protein
MYDIIGDIHGHASVLKRLFTRLGYSENVNGVWEHSERKAIFVGDFINRGPEIPETISIIKKMVEAEKALAIIGNHEFNAIMYYLRDEEGELMQKRSSKARLTMQHTLSQYSNDPDAWKAARKFFRRLPLFIDLGNIRFVHGAWVPQHIDLLKKHFPDGKLRKKHLRKALKNSTVMNALDETLKGFDYRLPFDLMVRDNRGINHRSFRIRWWEPMEGKTFRTVSFGNKFELPAYTIPAEICNKIESYPEFDSPVFFGHFCLLSGAEIVARNLCCVDSGIGSTGVLTAYRWSGEQELIKANLVTAR